MEASKAIPLYQIKVGEHFILQGTEYVRVGEQTEDGGIYCKNLKDLASGFLSNDRPVIRLEGKTFIAAVVGDQTSVIPTIPEHE